MWDWSDHADFLRRPPIIRILSGGLPTGPHGIVGLKLPLTSEIALRLSYQTRIEMDSTSIYLTSSQERAFEEHAFIEHVDERDASAYWLTISDSTHAVMEPVWPHDEAETAEKPPMRKFLREHGIIGNNTVLVYDFSGDGNAASALDTGSKSVSAGHS